MKAFCNTLGQSGFAETQYEHSGVVRDRKKGFYRLWPAEIRLAVLETSKLKLKNLLKKGATVCERASESTAFAHLACMTNDIA